MATHPEIEQLKIRIQELESLIQTVSLAKYMWESTFDAISSPVMIVSNDYHILRANRSAAQSAQIDVRAMIGGRCHKILAGSETPCEACPLERTLRLEEPQTHNLKAFPKNNREYRVNSYPLKQYLHGQSPQAVMYYQDITEENKLSRQLLQNEKMAAIGTLAGGVAHEVNNPLGGILAFAQLAMRELSEDHPVQHDLKSIEEATLRCKRIVQELLDFSRLSRDDQLIPTDLNEVIQKVINLTSVQNKTSQIKVQVNLHANLKRILGNSSKLQQIFMNLVTNAYQAMKEGGKLSITTLMNPEKTRVLAEIGDTGPGISPENIDQIFDPYFTTKAQGEGTGLGLSITFGLVKEHDGDIEVKSRLGEGTKFCLSFPILAD